MTQKQLLIPIKWTPTSATRLNKRNHQIHGGITKASQFGTLNLSLTLGFMLSCYFYSGPLKIDSKYLSWMGDAILKGRGLLEV